MGAPLGLRVEHLHEPLGVTAPRPRLTWRLPDGARHQSAYQLVLGGWDSGRVDSDQSVLVSPACSPFTARERISWKVKVWTDLGESEWSDEGSWEMGLVDPGDWSAQWIEPFEAEMADAGARPAQRLRKGFEITDSLARARLYITAHGIYEASINGVRVGDLELTPGFTAYRDVLQVQTFDVTDMLRVGHNVVGAVLSDGWFRGRVWPMRLADRFGTRTALLAQLEITHAGGSRQVIDTDASWRSSPSEIIAADLMDGQSVELDRGSSDWEESGFDVTDWAGVNVGIGGLYADFGRLGSSPSPAMRRIEEIRPIGVTMLSSGRQIVDLGQNINGWARTRVPAGDTLTLLHGEALNGDGDVTVDHLAIQSPIDGSLLEVGQRDRVGSREVFDALFEPRHTTHGFRYIRIDGASRRLTADDVTGVVVHTDMRRTGWFRCSDDRVNTLHEIAVWSFRDNACDIPTDCPTRERAGWTGDWMLYIPTAAFLYDVAGFSVKWLRSLVADQFEDGCMPNFSPEPGGLNGRHAYLGSSGWGDAAVIVPWELFRAYGDLEQLREFFPMMTAWVDFAAGLARGGRHESRVEARPLAAPHEVYLWDTGYHWGEWSEPGVDRVPRFADQSAVATAFLYRSSSLLARISMLLGEEESAARYDDLAENVRAAWQAEFIGADGSLHPDTQATHVRALAYGLVPDHLRTATIDRLVELIRAADNHLGTGFLATPHLLPVLADAGRLDAAYELLLSDTEPSWLSMVDAGATTIWEHWDGVRGEVINGSLNHYSKGAVISFLHSRVAGIRLDDTPGASSAGYRRFVVEPRPGGGLSWAEAELDSPYGRIRSSWRITDGVFELSVNVPSGSSATVVLPDGSCAAVTVGYHQFQCLMDETPVRAE
jgi:alpha-L-rhamnosidase